MALKPCKECGKEISTAAKQCPNCGVEFPNGQPVMDTSLGGNARSCLGCLVLIAIFVVGLFVLGSVS